jgi:lipopolysaccharide/colanic/teichoic acid biosynthesis glycosyltransferase
MRGILDRERMRSDRFKSSFALLTFTFSPHADERDVATLARILCDRVRTTDDVGHLGPMCLGAVLPETPADGGWKLAEDVRQLYGVDRRQPRCQVYVYPSGPAEPDDGIPAEVVQHDSGRSMLALFAQPLPAWKRALDVLGASTALIVASPVLLLAAVAVKLGSRGPILFAQKREGLGGRSFAMYKFRSMVVDADAMKADLRAKSIQDGPAFKLKNDPRVTPIGRLLRRTCIDELPQLFNVLKGDMSLVGPRPLPCDESRRCDAWGRRRLDVTPGLTCIWQVHGGSKVTFAEWMRMDLRYAGARSLWKDLRLMALTVPSIVRRDGVY